MGYTAYDNFLLFVIELMSSMCQEYSFILNLIILFILVVFLNTCFHRSSLFLKIYIDICISYYLLHF